MIRILLLLLISLTVTGCVVYPVATKEQQFKNCDLATKELSLKAKVYKGNLFAGCSQPSCIVGILAAIPAVSAATLIVSGSIVVAGNTIHWIEKQGRCDESVLRSATMTMKQSVSVPGTWVVETNEELVNWITQR